MKFLKEYIKKQKPLFEKGGPLGKYHTYFDGFATFLFTPEHVTHGGTHIKAGIDLKRTMIFVVLAMVPCLLFGIHNVGHQHFLSAGLYFDPMDHLLEKIIYGSQVVIPIVAVAYGAGLAVEFLVASKKGHGISEGYLVSGMLIPLIVPPSIPLWMVAVASIFAVIFSKEIFGGTGMNVLNVALTARVFLFFAYPTFMSGDDVWVSTAAESVDAFSGATALSLSAKGGMAALNGYYIPGSGGDMMYTWWNMFIGFIPGSIGETSTLMCLVGAAFLMLTGIGSWRVIVSVFLGAIVMGMIFNAIALNEFMKVPFYYHIVMGGLAFGAVFMATDPVTAAQTNRGKWIYGFLIGMFAILIRVFNPAYPEGIMLAILLLNVFAPLIDYYIVQANIKRRLARA